MNQEQVVPNESIYDAPTFDVLSEGEAIDPTFQVFSIVVHKCANRIPYAKLVVRDGEASEASFNVTDSDAFKPGKEIEIQAGYDGNNKTVFKGEVVKQKIKIVENGDTALYVDCRDAAYKMTLGRKNKYYEELKDSDVLEELLSEYSVAGEVEQTEVQHKELVQYYTTDWDFLCTRSEANGKLILVNDGQVDIKAPKITGEAAIQLAFGGNLLEFEAEIDARTQWKKVEAKAWDYANQENFQAESESVDFAENGNIDGQELADIGAPDTFDLRHSGHLPEDELQAWADACLLKSRLAKIQGRARFIGFVEIKVGQTASLSGVGERFSGTVYITGVRHELVHGTCYMDIQFGLDPKWFHQEPGIIAAHASGLIPGIKGLQIGKVVQLEGDPDGEERLLIKLPIIDADATGTWARLATLDAGADRGWVIRPEIDDEVIVGFINGDPRDAVVIGRLHSSANPAPIPSADDNHIKGYTSRSQMKVEFDDDQKIITISTPAGNTIMMTEADTEISIVDQNGNEYRMNPDGISLKSPADIKMEATGNIEIKATGDLKMEGLSVTATAQTQLKAEGSAGAELSSGGQTVVKGSIVMIN